MKEMQDLPKKPMLRISEAALYFCVHERTIRQWIEHGTLISEKVKGTRLISREAIKNFRQYYWDKQERMYAITDD